MNKYQLTPIESSDPCWKYSDITDPVIIEAETEQQAREIACHKYWKMCEVDPRSEDLPEDPWENPAKTKCELIN